MRRTFSLVALLTTTASGLAAMTAAAADFDPRNFDVNMNGGPQIQPPAPSCESDAAGAMTCSQSFSQSLSGFTMNGTVAEKSSGLAGKISTTCDMKMTQRMVFRSSAGAMTLVEFSGSGAQSCSWVMEFDDGSKMTGTFAGTMQLAKVSETTASMLGTFTVVVASGTGKFSGQVGTGSFEESEEFSMVGAPPRSLQIRAERSLPARDGSKMRLKLRRGQPLARIAAPGSGLEHSSEAKLRVVSAPGAVCTAVAASDGTKIDLGKARDANGDGSAIFSGRLASKLDRGRWELTATCSYRLGGRSGRATVKSTVRIS